MTYYTSPFGNGTLVGSGGNVTTNVHNQFGPRDAEGTVGVLKVEGLTEELIINVSAENYNDGIEPSLVEYTLPAGAVIKAVYCVIEEAFVLGGTNPVLDIGEDGAEATNGVTIDDSTLEAAVGTATNETANLAGEWDAEAPLPHDQVVKAVFSADSGLTIGDAGKARITIVYDRAALGL